MVFFFKYLISQVRKLAPQFGVWGVNMLQNLIGYMHKGVNMLQITTFIDT